ncbi:LysR family transcriptional regulator [Amycolatopsis sp. NPDC004378]
MNWEDLRTFHVVAEELSFSKAATRLHVSVSAVSQRIRRLERETKAALLNRTTTKVELTEAGRILLSAAANLNQTWEDAKRQVTQLGLPDREVTLGQYRETPRAMLERIVDASPGIDWQFRYYVDAKRGLDDLRDGTLDLFMWSTWSSENVTSSLSVADLDTVDIARERLWVHIRAHHPLANGPGVQLAQALDFPWISPVADQADLMRAILLDLGGRLPRFDHDVESLEDMNEILRISDTICLCPPGAKPSPGLVVRPLRPSPRSRYGVSRVAGRTDVAPVQEVLARVYRRRYAEKMREWNPAHWGYMLANAADYPGVVDIPEL